APGGLLTFPTRRSSDLDDSGGNTDSRLFTSLEAGDYQLSAEGIEGGDEGVYNLSITQREMPEGIDLSEGARLEVGKEYTGLLAGDRKSTRLNSSHVKSS